MAILTNSVGTNLFQTSTINEIGPDDMDGPKAHRMAPLTMMLLLLLSLWSCPLSPQTSRDDKKANHLHIKSSSPSGRKRTSTTTTTTTTTTFATTTRKQYTSNNSRLISSLDGMFATCICLAPLLLLSLTVRPISGGTNSTTSPPGSSILAAPAAQPPATTTTTANINGPISETNDTFSSDGLMPGTFSGMAALATASQFNSTAGPSDLAPTSGGGGGGSEDENLIFGVEIANSIIFVIGLCGNTMVIIVILKFTKIETVTDIYILNLAFADLMFIMGLLFLITTMHIDHWIFGNLMCKLYMATTSLNQFASSLLLVVMSFDRFLAVCHPIYAQRFRRPRRAKIICLAIWVACLILMTPIFVFAKTNKDLTCAIFWPEYKSFNCEMVFTFYSFAIGFAVPLLLIAAFYLQVLRKLRVAASGPISLGSRRRSKSRETTNRRVEHLVIGIIFTYTMCWLPYWITQMYVSVSMLQHSPFEGFYPFFLVATSLSYTNSALNPILYAFLSDNFKRRCSEIGRTISSINWCHLANQSYSQSNHATTATTSCHEYSEASARPESRQTVSLNESVRFITSPYRNKTNNGNQYDNNNNNNKNYINSKISDNQEEEQEEQQQFQLGESGLSLMVKSTIDPTSGYDHNNNDYSCKSQNHQRQTAPMETSNKTNQNKVDLNNNNKILNVCGADGQRKKSVNFSVDTVVVQDLNNNETIKGNHHTIIPMDSNNNNNNQNNNNNNNQCHGV